MNDDKDIRELFEGFNPRLSDERLFMRRLEDKMESLNQVMERQASMKRMYRRAMIAAFLTGVICGIGIAWLCMTFMPALPAIQIPRFNMNIPLGEYRMVISYVAAIGFAGLLAINTYDLSLYLQRSRSHRY